MFNSEACKLRNFLNASETGVKRTVKIIIAQGFRCPIERKSPENFNGQVKVLGAVILLNSGSRAFADFDNVFARGGKVYSAGDSFLAFSMPFSIISAGSKDGSISSAALKSASAWSGSFMPRRVSPR